MDRDIGVLDKYDDFYVKAQKKMIPSLFGTAFKLFKAVAPGRAFKQIINQFVYTTQFSVPLSNTELTMASDREAILRTKDCPRLKKFREVVKKAGLEINPIAICAREAKNFPEYGKMFGIDMKVQFKKNGCITTAKLI